MDQLPILAVLLGQAQGAAAAEQTAAVAQQAVMVETAANLAEAAAEAALDLRVVVLAAVAVPAKYGS
jgi:hypothetical protein